MVVAVMATTMATTRATTQDMAMASRASLDTRKDMVMATTTVTSNLATTGVGEERGCVKRNGEVR